MTKLKFIYAQVNIYAINLHLIAFVDGTRKTPQNNGQNQIKFENMPQNADQMPIAGRDSVPSIQYPVPNTHYQY